jgi:hypothetical protein
VVLAKGCTLKFYFQGSGLKRVPKQHLGFCILGFGSHVLSLRFRVFGQDGWVQGSRFRFQGSNPAPQGGGWVRLRVWVGVRLGVQCLGLI